MNSPSVDSSISNSLSRTVSGSHSPPARTDLKSEALPEPGGQSQQLLTTLWLVRHAEVEARYQGVFGGRIDMELSPRGRQQAQALAGYLNSRRFDAFYCSPMKRVQQTIKPLLANGTPPAVTLPELREVDFGIWTGLSWGEVLKRYGFNAFDWLDALESDAIPEAESGADLLARLRPCLESLIARHPRQQVLVACHGGVIRALLAILLDLPLPKFGGVEIEYASVTQVVLAPHRNQLQLLNFTPWRDL